MTSTKLRYFALALMLQERPDITVGEAAKLWQLYIKKTKAII